MLSTWWMLKTTFWINRWVRWMDDLLIWASNTSSMIKQLKKWKKSCGNSSRSDDAAEEVQKERNVKAARLCLYIYLLNLQLCFHSFTWLSPHLSNTVAFSRFFLVLQSIIKRLTTYDPYDFRHFLPALFSISVSESSCLWMLLL